jgi:hypothetical protein
LRDFLSELLIGEDKIFSPDTKLIDISYIANENIQDAPNHVAKNFFLDIVVETNKGQVVIEMQKKLLSKTKILKRIRFYASSLHLNQEIFNMGKSTSQQDYNQAARVLLITVVG